ncbi:hypothetical protein [Streptomyces sp. NPDC059850]|uniref:hypothetical protein n=1 Tax=Streptomyces sp. NPDC059850 TaxID=3346970 RepID=UPI003651871F
MHDLTGPGGVRQLAAYGFVADDPERGKGRERWWKAAHGTTKLATDELLRHPDPSVRGAMNTLLHEWPAEWRANADISDYMLRLTPELAREMLDKVHEVIESYREKGVGPDAEHSARYRVHLHGFPRDED